MGLVDTPSPSNGKVVGDANTQSPASAKSKLQSGQKRTPGRKRALDRLEWHGAGSQPSPPPLSASQGSASRGAWQCEQCTLLNRGRARFCEVCGAPKPSTPARTRAATTRGRPTPDDDDHDDDDDARDGDGGGGAGGRGDGTGAVGENSANGSGSQQPRDGKEGAAGEGGGDDGEASPSQPPAAGKWRRQDRREDARGMRGTEAVAGSTRVDSESERSADETGAGFGDEQSDRDRGSAASASAKGGAGAAAGKTKGDTLQGFVGDTGALDWDSEEGDWEGGEEEEEEEEGGDDSDEDYFEDGDLKTAELIGSQIEEMFLRSQGDVDASQRSVQSVDTTSPSPKRQRLAPRLAPKAGQVLDLTDTVDNDNDNFDEDNGRRGGGGGGGGGDRASEIAAGAVEDISDDDSDGDFRLPGMMGGRAADTRRGSSSPPPLRKFRFFSSVKEHRDRSTSCVDFSSLEAAPAGGSSSARSYTVRRTARDRKKGGKGGKAKRGAGKKKSRAAAPRATTAAGRGRGKSRGGGGSGSGRAAARGGRGGGAAGVPSSWIPAGVPSGGSAAATVRRGGGGGSGAGVQRHQPFNHYRGNDEMVDDSIGGGGFHWEGVGQASFGGD